MKKMGKILAVILSLAMILGMSITTFAAERTAVDGTATITINGLAAGTDTTVKVYQVAILNEDKSTWDVQDWVPSDAVTNNNAGAEATFDWGALETAATTATAYKSVVASGTSVDIKVDAIGAYLILASDAKATYTVMGTATYSYDKDTGIIKAADKTVNAKSSGFEVTKESSDGFVAKGQNVDFTITSTFPTWQDNDSSREYKIVDTPTGLDIDTDSVEVTVGGVKAAAEAYTVTKDENGAVTVAFKSEFIGIANEHAGQTVVVALTAEVTSVEGYSNTANASKDDQNQDQNPPTVSGYQGDITITKYDADGGTILEGAEFSVTKDGDTEALYFVKVNDGVYNLAKATENGASQTVAATNGTVQIKGLGEGSYHFTETTAPAGYSINADGVTVEITKEAAEAATAAISLTGSLTDTKLSALPSTGGIGTTIFTIGGCLIMIAAAALFFANRRKSVK